MLQLPNATYRQEKTLNFYNVLHSAESISSMPKSITPGPNHDQIKYTPITSMPALTTHPIFKILFEAALFFRTELAVGNLTV